MQVHFTVNVGRRFTDSTWCPLNRACLLDTAFTVFQNLFSFGTYVILVLNVLKISASWSLNLFVSVNMLKKNQF